MSRKTLALTIFLAMPCLAGQIDQSTFESAEFRNAIRDTTTELLLKQLRIATACADTAMNHDVSRATLRRVDALQLSESDATAAMLYLAFTAQERCVGSSLPLEAINYLHYARKLGVSDYAEPDDPGQKHLSAMLFDGEQRVKAEYLYRRIPQVQREALERIDELRQPFNISILSRIRTVD